jgi:hypothetical protein
VRIKRSDDANGIMTNHNCTRFVTEEGSMRKSCTSSWPEHSYTRCLRVGGYAQAA